MNALERYAKKAGINPFMALLNLYFEVYGEVNDSVIGIYFMWKKTNKLPKELADRLSVALRPPR